ncbi:MAG: GTP 3',8-cyclase MoaA [Pyrinomonadaceae bacterium]|nr:GTP 3',8-cyclase MoaA [Pyrinomonadaceae bacterium]MCX7640306.1 GTP 3',8-cyclase MoaA [Pyrinomonadaceae bacterium]MDW8303380.1 GTP 3',8-cyclase MoaA [Acidobacteriota bacterium]
MRKTLKDAYGRTIKDLRISVTDRCNFRCFYCLPHGEPPIARKDKILTFEEIERISKIFVSLGIEKIRLTGGEPLLRKDIEILVEKLARLKAVYFNGNKLRDFALTTNGHTLAKRAKTLKQLGLDRVTISLDSLKREKFEKITGTDKLEEVLEAIKAAKEAGLAPVKINAVIVRGWNDDEIVALAEFARQNELIMRFIEYMPLDSAKEWRRGLVVSGKEIFEKINQVFPLEPKSTCRGSSTSWQYIFKDGAKGEIGIISPVTDMFCGACSRIRLTADGQIRTCLFSVKEYNLRDFVRSGASDEEIAEFIEAVTLKKEPRHYINDPHFMPASRSMSFIGG